MNMDADKTDVLIAKAIAALPYRKPFPGFASRVMAEIVLAPQAELWQGYALKAAEFTVAAWTAALGFVCTRLVYSNLPEIAAIIIQPGGVWQAFRLLAARTVLIGAKLAAVVSFTFDLSVSAAGFPAYHEIVLAVLFCSAAIAALSRSGHASALKRGI